MKSSNLAWRVEPIVEHAQKEPAARLVSAIEAAENRGAPPLKARRRARTGHRSIEIRDQGFAPFRVR